MRKVVIAVIADHEQVVALRNRGMSWSRVAAQFDWNRSINLTPAKAEAFYRDGFGIWVERRNRMLIMARIEAFVRLRGLSAVVGEHVAENLKRDWVGPFLRDQFLKFERS